MQQDADSKEAQPRPKPKKGPYESLFRKLLFLTGDRTKQPDTTKLVFLKQNRDSYDRESGGDLQAVFWPELIFYFTPNPLLLPPQKLRSDRVSVARQGRHCVRWSPCTAIKCSSPYKNNSIGKGGPAGQGRILRQGLTLPCPKIPQKGSLVDLGDAAERASAKQSGKAAWPLTAYAAHALWNYSKEDAVLTDCCVHSLLRCDCFASGGAAVHALKKPSRDPCLSQNPLPSVWPGIPDQGAEGLPGSSTGCWPH